MDLQKACYNKSLLLKKFGVKVYAKIKSYVMWKRLPGVDMEKAYYLNRVKLFFKS